ncbi:amidohydrolase [Microlunatus elymi]|uniref:Amidohydrolase n=1 Tax=Microlunatus elymi TaxID=2596828 RepID=A0A516Q3R4_9ACTN|nr:amidohydrolase family protein [Microlunatus elymi]QDP98068.1 amidohydrolase [Microlunatus elymi]
MGKIIDAHAHLQLSDEEAWVDAPHRLPDYQQATADLQLSRFAVLVMAPAGDLHRTRAQNDYALSVAGSDERAFALCSVHPDDGDRALAEIDRVARAGAAGLKLHPSTQQFDVASEELLAVVRRAGDHGLPVLFDSVAVADPGQPEKFVGLAMSCPDTELVLAHTFGPKFVQAVMFSVLSRYPGTRRNVYLELSATVCMFADSPYVEQLAWLCRRHGLDRVLWGSDYPLFSPTESLQALTGFGFSGDEFEQVTHHTAASVYHLA